MIDTKTQPRVWHLNWSDIRSLEGRGAYLYNPKGEMVAIIFEQDRPEAEGVTVQIMESLNAQHAPRVSHGSTGRWWCARCGVAVLPAAVTNDERHDPRDGGCGDTVEWDAPKGVDVEKVWERLQEISLKMLATNHGSPSCCNISKNDLATALLAAKGEQ